MKLNNFTIAQKRQTKALYYATLILFLPIFAGLFFVFNQEKNTTHISEQKNLDIPIVIKSVSLDDVFTTAHSALVLNLQTGEVLYDKNSNKLLPLASLTKLVTAKVASDSIEIKNIPIHKMTDFPQYGDAKLLEGELWSTQDLITYTLITSSNDGAHSLLTNSVSDTPSFTQKMNSLAATIGLAQTQFYNETGLDNDTVGIPGSKGTAQEVGKILSYLIKNDLEIFEKTKYSQIQVQTPQGSQLTSNTNDSASKITGLLLSKTGYTDLAGGNLAIVADMGLNEPTAFIVLKSSRESRFDDILNLQEAYFEELRKGMRE